MRVFAVLILVSSLTYSVVYLLSQNPNALEWEANIQNISIDCCQHYPFVSLWMFEQKWFAITERIKAKQKKKDFNVFLTRFEEKNT
jgi:hypothetical protein